jgi:hypothetical protein
MRKMGYIMHDAIIVTAFRKPDAETALAKARSLEIPTSDLVASAINGYYTFLIAPDGSKEGWADSDKFDKLRAQWIEWAGKQYAENVFLDWIYVRYGESPPYVAGSSRGDEEE